MDNKALESLWAVLGAFLLVTVLASLGLVAVGGWPWFARFLESAAPNWIQAGGSLLAIFVALGIAAWQRYSDREAEAMKVRVRAELASTGVLLKMNPLLGCFGSLLRMLQAVRRDGEAVMGEHWADLMDRQDFPTEEELVAIVDQDPQCARLLIQGRNLARQARLAFGLIAKQEEVGAQALDHQIAHVEQCLQFAYGRFDLARQRLERLIPAEMA